MLTKKHRAALGIAIALSLAGGLAAVLSATVKRATPQRPRPEAAREFYAAEEIGAYKPIYFEKSPAPPETLYVISKEGMNEFETVMVASLQGLLVKKQPRIFIDNGASAKLWMQDLEENHGVRMIAIEDPWALVDLFRDEISGYIAYTVSEEDSSSLNVATTMAGFENGILVEKSIAEKAGAAGLPLIEDVSGKTDEWSWERYGGRTNRRILLEQRCYPGDGRLYCLRDYAIMTGAYAFYPGQGELMNRVLDAQEPDSIMLGWGEEAENEQSASANKRGINHIASDWGMNWSALSGIYAKQLRQETNARPEDLVTGKKHVVTILYTDGDNMQWLTGSFATDEKYWAAKSRGTFDLGFGMNNLMLEAAPTVMDYLYRTASNTARGKDYFFVGPHMAYPSEYPAESLASYTANLARTMGQGDLKYVQIIDNNYTFGKNAALFDEYTKHEEIEGLFYIEYDKYCHYEGKVKWSNGKPVITSRYQWWDNGDETQTAQYIADKINKAPRNLKSPSAYSAISVHCWSYTVDDIKRLVDSFGPDVAVVTPDVFMQTFQANVRHW